MTSNWLWPGIATILLWIPFVTSWHIRKSSRAQRLSGSPPLGAVVKYWPNWADLFRCLVATAILAGWGTAMRTENPESGMTVMGVILIAGIGCLFIQSILVSTRRTIFAPLPFSIAIALGLTGWATGIFSVIAAIALATASGRLTHVLPILASVLFVGGWLLGDYRPDLVIASILIMTPHAMSFVLARRIILPSNVKLHR